MLLQVSKQIIEIIENGSSLIRGWYVVILSDSYETRKTSFETVYLRCRIFSLALTTLSHGHTQKYV